MAERKINDRMFKTGEVLALDAIKLQNRIIQTIGSSSQFITDMMAGLADAKADELTKGTRILQAVVDVVSKNASDDIANLLKDICELAMVSYDGGKTYAQIDFDGDFTGRLGDVLPVSIWVCTEVLGDFFTGMFRNGSQKKTRAA